jgi:cysteine desulfurase
MQVNNETGIRQPIDEIAKILTDHKACFHTDAAQGFGKDIESLRNPRIDLISISGHKIYAPMGIGALIIRRRGYDRPPLQPLLSGGGQERGLRPGTLPVALIVALGKAAEIRFVTI